MRLCRAFVSLEFFQSLLFPGRRLQLLAGFPRDAQIRTVVFAAERGGFWLVIESPTYDDILEGDLLPEVTICVRIFEEQEG